MPEARAVQTESPDLPPLGWLQSLLIFAAAGLVLLIVTRVVIPVLAAATSMETVFYWFVCAGLLVFLPLIGFAFVLLKREKAFDLPTWWAERLRFRSLSRTDGLWALGGLLGIGALSGVMMMGVDHFFGPSAAQPTFMAFEPLTPDRYWLLAVWFPYWLLNIMGEEILWRGVLLPRQEKAFGSRAFLIHAVGWALFHVAFGWRLFFSLIPILVILPWMVQKRKNSWIGVILHAGLNGPAFIAISFGVI